MEGGGRGGPEWARGAIPLCALSLFFYFVFLVMAAVAAAKAGWSWSLTQELLILQERRGQLWRRFLSGLIALVRCATSELRASKQGEVF